MTSTEEEIYGLLLGNQGIEQLLADEPGEAKPPQEPLEQPFQPRDASGVIHLGVTGADWQVVQRFLRGYLPTEISDELGLPLHSVRTILNRKQNQEFITSIRSDAHGALQNLVTIMVRELRGLLTNSDPQVRLGASREVAKILGLYSDKRSGTTAEDIVGMVLGLARDSLAIARDSGEAARFSGTPARRQSISRLIDGEILDAKPS